VTGVVLLAGFSVVPAYCGTLAGVDAQDKVLLDTLPERTLEFSDIKPVLERRCIVCHGCFDAPCQLKLSSYAGMQRGASKLKAYNKMRLSWQQPTRMFIDADSEAEWREMAFFSVLGGSGPGTTSSPEANLDQSLIYHMLSLKQQNPLHAADALPDVSIERKQVCTQLAGFDAFAAEHPDWGMPYALPGLSDADHALLVQWLAQGAKASVLQQPGAQSQKQVRQWEAFFNGPDNKKRLASRYIYEHLVLGHVHFADAPADEFFRLVRSRSASGAIDEIPSIRPFDDPEGPFYYRLRPYQASIVDKSHIVYELSEARMRRFEQLFMRDDYTVVALPAYDPGESLSSLGRFYHNILKLVGLEKPQSPFEVFADIPVESRYAFLLDDARFFINGFIKGPVCRGLDALSSIEDQFWVFFLKPENPQGIVQHGLNGDFIRANDNLLHLPTELFDTRRVLNAWIKYWPEEQKYMQAKLDYYQQIDHGGKLFPIDIHQAVDQFVWDGVNDDGSVNPNAALTVFRNLDSAMVQYGLQGSEPETAWMIDYPIFERLHYLLVAGYNNFGTLGHQASARLYMDFLRMEGEDTFLFFLPVERRKQLYEFWHGVDRSSTREQNFDLQSAWLNADSVSGYDVTGSHQQHQLFEILRGHIAAKSPDMDSLNRCRGAECIRVNTDRAMQRLAGLSGKSSDAMPLQYFPAVSYMRVGGEQGTAYTLIYNKTYRSYKQDSFVKKVFNRSNEDMSGDTMTIERGLAGSYPNYFFDVKADELDAFVATCEQISSQADYQRLEARFGVDRRSSAFWPLFDWFQSLHSRKQPIEGGVLDLSRYSVMTMQEE